MLGTFSTIISSKIFSYPFFFSSSVQFSSVQSLSHVWLFAIPWTAARQASLSITNSGVTQTHVLSGWCHPTISSSVVPFSSCLQSFPASGSFQISQFFTSGGQSIGVSASASVLPMNIQDWFPLGWSDWISLLSKGPSRDPSPNYKQGEKTALRLGENNSKRSNRQRINLKNIQATPPAQLQKNKWPKQKMGQRTKQTLLQGRHTDG